MGLERGGPSRLAVFPLAHNRLTACHNRRGRDEQATLWGTQGEGLCGDTVYLGMAQIPTDTWMPEPIKGLF
jgi:hypothetical protein